MPRVVKSTPVEPQQTFDLELSSDDHQFYLSNGLLTSNSHATSYAICSVQCAHLLTYHPDEWICSYIESCIGDREKLSKAISEARAQGYTVKNIDINQSTDEWSIVDDKQLSPSLLSIKGLGEAAVKELLLSRPFTCIDDLLWREDGTWRHSKFNKTAFGALIKAHAFGSMNLVGDGCLFQNYKHLHAVIIDHWNDLKKKSAKQSLYELIESNKCDDWSREEKVANLVELFGDIDVGSIVNHKLISELEERGALSIDSDLIQENGRGLAWFLVIDFTLKRSKNGNMYFLIDAMGSTSSKTKLFCWGAKAGSTIKKYALCVAEVKVDDFGMTTSVFKMREIDA